VKAVDKKNRHSFKKIAIILRYQKISGPFILLKAFASMLPRSYSTQNSIRFLFFPNIANMAHIKRS
jgi:hypothetical protein